MRRTIGSETLLSSPLAPISIVGSGSTALAAGSRAASPVPLSPRTATLRGSPDGIPCGSCDVVSSPPGAGISTIATSDPACTQRRPAPAAAHFPAPNLVRGRDPRGRQPTPYPFRLDPISPGRGLGSLALRSLAFRSQPLPRPVMRSSRRGRRRLSGRSPVLGNGAAAAAAGSATGVPATSLFSGVGAPSPLWPLAPGDESRRGAGSASVAVARLPALVSASVVAARTCATRSASV